MNLKDYVINIRRMIHECPELGFEEFKTQELITKELDGFGIGYKKFGTGVVAEIGNGDEVIVFRADMDALPIQEETGKPYASKIDGKMHACGHDSHVAILLGVIRELASQKSLKISEKKLRFIFQPNEEGTNGADFMIKNGALGREVKAIFGLHVKPDLETGIIGLKYGEMMAAVDEFKITLKGFGGHAAMPHTTQDVILVGSQMVQAINTIVSRNVSPMESAVVSVCKFHSGTAFNIIPKECEILGTIRTFDENTREVIKGKMKAIVESYSKANNVECQLKIDDLGKALVNDEKLVELVEKIAKKTFGKEKVLILNEPSMGGEDFAEYLQTVPGCYFYIGSMNKEKGIVYGWHNPKFDIDEDGLETGVRLFLAIIEEELK